MQRLTRIRSWLVAFAISGAACIFVLIPPHRADYRPDIYSLAVFYVLAGVALRLIGFLLGLVGRALRVWPPDHVS